MRISDWSSYVCSSDLLAGIEDAGGVPGRLGGPQQRHLLGALVARQSVLQRLPDAVLGADAAAQVADGVVDRIAGRAGSRREGLAVAEQADDMHVAVAGVAAE